MIQDFVDAFMKNKSKLQAKYEASHPENYRSIVKDVITLLNSDGEHRLPDPRRIHEIDDGDYQGTLLFVIASGGYQPGEYWFVKVSYGSCSACDTLEAIRQYDDDPPTSKQVEGYMTLALHIVQGLKRL